MKRLKKIFIIKILFFVAITNVFAYFKAPVNITNMDIYELQEAVDKGYLTYELLTRLYLDRINAYDKKYNAIISINENAIEEAKKCDEEYQKNGRSSILFGIPIIVKDNIDVEGLATTAGSKSLKDSIPYNDSDVITKLKEKGMIVLAKSNMSEFAFMASSSVSSYGTTKNAYNTKYSSYGSSGGSAVSVSVQYAPVALGTDTNSSLRAPAAANGVIGFRSTLGLINTNGIIAYDTTRDVVGPIAKTVKESALLLEVMAGKEEGTYTNELRTSLEGKTIAVLDQFAYGDSSLKVYGTGTTYSEVKRLFNEALDKMEEAGAKIIHIDNFFTKEFYSVTNKTQGGWTLCNAFNKYIKNTSSKIKSFYDLTYSDGHIYSLWGSLSECSISMSKIEEQSALKTGYREHVNNLIKEYSIDAFVYPTTKTKLMVVGGSNFECPSYVIGPVLGMPAVSMPLGFDKDDLAYGMEFVSSKNNEKVLYQLISAYESVNNTYKLPSIAPALYEVPDEVEKLKTLYEDNQKTVIISLFNSKDIKNYKIALQDIEDFFNNYNDYDDEEQTAITLYENYQETLNNLNPHFSIVISILIILLVVFILLKIVLKIRKKIKKLKRKKHSRR